MPAKKATAKKVARKPQQQKMVDFGTAIVRFWTNYTNFNGTAQRSEFWFWVLFNAFVTLPFSIIGLFDPVAESVLLLPWWLATFIPWIALYSRRFHDAGFSAKLLWIPLLCIIGVFILLGLMSLAANVFEMFLFVSIVSSLALLGWCIFLFVVCLLPSKFKDNPYRE